MGICRFGANASAPIEKWLGRAVFWQRTGSILDGRVRNLLPWPAYRVNFRRSVRAMNLRQSDVLILGGGAVGLACALYLLRAGRSVTVLDRGEVGAATS